jgi:hypothetical protein
VWENLDFFATFSFNRHVGVGGSLGFLPRFRLLTRGCGRGLDCFCHVFVNRHVGVGRSRPFATFSLTDTWVWDGLVFDAFSNRHVGL